MGAPQAVVDAQLSHYKKCLFCVEEIFSEVKACKHFGQDVILFQSRMT